MTIKKKTAKNQAVKTKGSKIKKEVSKKRVSGTTTITETQKIADEKKQQQLYTQDDCFKDFCNEDMISVELYANRKKLTNEGARKQLLGIPYKLVGKGGQARKMYKIGDIKAFQQQQQQVGMAKLDNKTDKMVEKYDNKELAVAYGKTLENRTAQECYEMGMQLLQITLGKVMEQSKKELEEKQDLIQQLQEKNQELQAYQNENKYIQETRHKIDVLKAKIVKAVRTRAFQEKWGYNETYIRFYKIYDEAHNFPYREDYKGYIDVIEKRGHLLELYKIIIND